MSIDLVNYPTNYAVLCQINQIVEDGFSLTAGRIRSAPVTIGGSHIFHQFLLKIKWKKN